VLTGVESNGGQLLIHTIGDDWDLFQSGTLPGVPAKDMIVDGNTMFCRCSNKIVALDITLQGSPTIRHEMAGFDGELVDFAKQDSLIYLITAHTYSIYAYNSNSGFILESTLNFPYSIFSGLAQQGGGAFILKGELGTLLRINATIPQNPVIYDETRLPQPHYSHIELLQNTLWISGEQGTDVISTNLDLHNLAYFGPDYFSDVRKIYLSNDTMYVADGVNGLKVYTFSGHPYAGLSYIGGYKTGNVVNQIARVERNFYISDYYSLQHLRWGAADAIGEKPISQLPDGFTLEQNYPNPFNSSTSIKYSIPAGEQSTLNIYDICGRSVRVIPVISSGNIVWNGRDDADKTVSSGVYFYTINGSNSDVRRMLLIK
jgi:hypothetical protein